MVTNIMQIGDIISLKMRLCTSKPDHSMKFSTITEIIGFMTKYGGVDRIELLGQGQSGMSEWCVAVVIIQFDVPLLVSSLPAYPVEDTENRIKQAFNSDSKLSITTTSINFSLKCPLTGLHICLSCRSSKCQHLQCFDARALICLGVETQMWICPICSTPIPYKTLLTDTYL